MNLQYFSKQLKLFRTEHSMTIIDLSNKSGVAKSAISDYENKRRTPKRETIEKLANALQVAPEELTEVPTKLDILLNKEYDRFLKIYQNEHKGNGMLLRMQVVIWPELYLADVPIDLEDVKNSLHELKNKKYEKNRIINNVKERAFMVVRLHNNQYNELTHDLENDEEFVEKMKKEINRIPNMTGFPSSFTSYISNHSESKGVKTVNYINSLDDLHANNFYDEWSKYNADFDELTETYKLNFLKRSKEKDWILKYEKDPNFL